MKKLLGVLLVSMSIGLLMGCFGDKSPKETLYVLNWGEYMDEDLVRDFEEEYNVRVVYTTVLSNEQMETSLKTSGVNYDIMIPSDYMIDKLHQEDLLMPIDKNKLPNYSEIEFFEDARILYEDEAFGDYMIPYFFGTIGIIYNTTVPGLQAAIESAGICVLFDANTPYAIGMYNSPRDAVGAALLCLGYSVNTTVEAHLIAAENLLATAVFADFGEDNLKMDVAQGNLDMALVYSGDYFDVLFVYEEEEEPVLFDFYTPTHTNMWIDAFVIPTTSQNPDLAHAFINYFLAIDVAVANADYVGYTPVIVEVYNLMVNDYGYDNAHYYPNPLGHTREAYRYVSQAHSNRLFDILSNIRN